LCCCVTDNDQITFSQNIRATNPTEVSQKKMKMQRLYLPILLALTVLLATLPAASAEPAAAAGEEPAAAAVVEDPAAEPAAAVLEARNQTIRQLVTRLRAINTAYTDLYAIYTQQQLSIDQLQQELASSRRRLSELQQQQLAAETPPAPAEPSLAALPPAARPLQPLLDKAQHAADAGDSEAAIWQYEQILREDPRHYEALTRLGEQLVARGDDTAAEAVLQRAFRINPDDPRVLHFLGVALLRQEQVLMAIAMFSRAVAVDADDAALLQNLGLACKSLGWNDAAEQYFHRAAELDSDNNAAAYNLAVLHATALPPRLDAARKWYQAARDRGHKPDPGLEAVLEQR